MASERPAVIVTGSSGLLGHPVSRRLAELGFEVYAFDRVGPPEPPADEEHIWDVDCDVTDESSVRAAVAKVRTMHGEHIVSVVHMAAYYDFSGEDSPLYQRVTVEGTDRLLRSLSSCSVEQFIFTSTMLVHRPAEIGKLINEDSPLEAKWPYPQSKIETERVIAEQHSDVPSVFLRVAGVYTKWGVQPTLVQQIKRIYERSFQSHFFPGDMRAGQSAVFLDDAVDAITKTVQYRQRIKPQTAILIGESEPPSYEELQDYIGRAVHGDNWTTMYVPPPLAKVGAAVTDTLSGGEAFIKPFMVEMADDHYALDISRAKRLLDWSPRHRLRAVLPDILRNLLDQPEEWYSRNGLGEPQKA